MKYGIFPDLSEITVDWKNFDDDLTRKVFNFADFSNCHWLEKDAL